jgi:hypothetical protein
MIINKYSTYISITGATDKVNSDRGFSSPGYYDVIEYFPEREEDYIYRIRATMTSFNKSIVVTIINYT